MDGAQPPPAPSTGLAQLCEDLGTLKSRIAEEFFALAAVLQTNSQRAREITKASHEATGAGMSLRSAAAIGLLQGVLNDSASVTSMVEISTSKMAEILTMVHGIATPLRKLTRMSSMLQIVSILCRIEGGTITHGAVDIEGLSHDIDSLAGEVEVHIRGILDDSSRLSCLLATGIHQLSNFATQEGVAARDLISQIRTVLSPMLARSAAAQEAARSVDEQYTSFHRATDKVVMSLQSEDIARQRIEHVEHALRQAASRLDAGEPANSTAHILILQRAQLAGVRDLLTASIDAIRDGLQSLGPRVTALVEQTPRLAREIDQNSHGFATLLDSGLDSMGCVFLQCASSAASVMEIVNTILPSVEQMTGRARALHDIELSISLISLNATVKTSLLGSDGAAMGVLATELHSITRERSADTTFVLGGLKSINKALAEIEAGKFDTQHTSILDPCTVDTITSEFSALSSFVETGTREMTAGLELVRQLAKTFSSELARSVGLANHAESLASLFDTALRDFDLVLETLGIDARTTVSFIGDQQAIEMASLYSMDSERILHNQIFADNTTAESSHSPLSSIPGTGEFGDDVQLF